MCIGGMYRTCNQSANQLIDQSMCRFDGIEARRKLFNRHKMAGEGDRWIDR